MAYAEVAASRPGRPRRRAYGPCAPRRNELVVLRPIRTLVLYVGAQSSTFSYQTGWVRAFNAHPAFDTVALNLSSRSGRLQAFLALRRRNRFDAVVLLHTVLSHGGFLESARLPLLDALAGLSQPKACFLAHEEKNQPQRMALCESAGISLLVSVYHDSRVRQIYEQRLPGTSVISIPFGGLDEEIFTPGPPLAERPIDIGYRAMPDALYQGHFERVSVADRVREHPRAAELTLDISTDFRDRFAPGGWADFLRRCRSHLGCEAGVVYFEINDQPRLHANAYYAENPAATTEELNAIVQESRTNDIGGRALPGRVVEAAATRTVQILVEGRYDGYFAPDEHYIPLRRDFSNLDEAFDKLASPDLCRRLVDAAEAVARTRLTYRVLLDGFARELAAQLG